MPRIDIDSVPERTGSGYPAPFAQLAGARIKQALGNTGGLADFGVNLTRLPPGAWSSQRHWHTHEDEFVYVLSGELTLITDAGEQTLRANDCAAFPKAVADGHHLVRLHAAQDGDEPAALQDVEQGFVDGVHAARLPAVKGCEAEGAGATTSPAANAICHSPVAVACVAMVGAAKPWVCSATA